jgi:hypothetical protein
MAGGAVLWSWLVKEDEFVGDQPGQLMALTATDVAMRPLQRESCPPIVVEQ